MSLKASPVPTANQQTIARSVYCVGTGLHTGANVALSLHPAPPGHGLVFVRADLDGDNQIYLSENAVADVLRQTRLANSSGAEIGTVEHLLSVLMALNIDNLRMEVAGPELPVLDGSAAEFLAMIQSAGLREQDMPARTLVVRREVQVQSGESQARFLPAKRLSVKVSIAYPDTLIGHQEIDMQITPESFASQIALARTFVLETEVDALRAAGQAKGGDLNNCVKVLSDGVENPEGLRFADEFVRHKALDVLGDLAVCGLRLQGRYEADRVGHHINHKALAALLSDPDNFTIMPPDAQET